jgi:hypothetical protein
VRRTIVDEVLNATLWTAVLNRLDYLDSLARDADEPSKAVLADTDLLTGLTGDTPR